ncbi:MAG: response regulator [Halanaerobiaceae bacterium]
MSGSALIVDDSKFMHLILEEILEKMGYKTISAYNGEEAINSYIENEPDLITLDINLPDIDGLQVIKSIKEIDSNSKVVMCTALNQDKFIDKSIKLGANGFIAKPFTEDKFVNVINDAVRK